MKSLLNVPGGGQARLASAGGYLLRKLRQYGLHVGDELRVIRTAPPGVLWRRSDSIYSTRS